MIDMCDRYEENCFLEMSEEFWREKMKGIVVLRESIK
jgi:hypothetical protein